MLADRSGRTERLLSEETNGKRHKTQFIEFVQLSRLEEVGQCVLFGPHDSIIVNVSALKFAILTSSES